MAQDHPVLAALAVLVRDEQVLLVKRRNPPDVGRWGFPGGKVELGETVFHAAERELAEETGLRATAKEFLTCVDEISEGGQQHHYALVAVLCDEVEGTLGAADDAEEAAWFPIGEIFYAGIPLSRGVAEVAKLAVDRGLA